MEIIRRRTHASKNKRGKKIHGQNLIRGLQYIGNSPRTSGQRGMEWVGNLLISQKKGINSCYCRFRRKLEQSHTSKATNRAASFSFTPSLLEKGV